ncbi:MAG: hypothetical protein KF901_20835 [Myxococcales bacterium]|nr:hypothetical protein [Myxococcales bacterium]
MLREGAGVLLVVAALVALFVAVLQLRGHDYVATMVLVVIGLALLGAGVELLRPSTGE